MASSQVRGEQVHSCSLQTRKGLLNGNTTGSLEVSGRTLILKVTIGGCFVDSARPLGTGYKGHPSFRDRGGGSRDAVQEGSMFCTPPTPVFVSERKGGPLGLSSELGGYPTVQGERAACPT